jgi:polysaccharide deacetylase family protein (PEP-CTERM system associated)
MSHTRHILTFDIEEWFHLVGVRAMDDRSRWASLEPTVEPLTDSILTLLADTDTKATFFVLGWVAERYPRLVARIAEQGHELASHSYWHFEAYKHTSGTFRADLGRSIQAIENAAGVKVRGFRAPSFSLTPGCEWAWDVMLDLGLTYDASVFPTPRAHGGYPCGRGDEKRGQSPFLGFPTPSGRSIRVLPMSVIRLLGRPLAFSGGGYFRVWPWRLVQRGFAQHDAAGRPAVAYLHPWDFAPNGPALPMRPHQRFKCYFHRDQTERRLRALLERYDFGPCERTDDAIPN